MKKIIHISDLHFGTENQDVVETLLCDIANNEPDLTVISGDLTQRAKSKQFQQAAEFLAQIKAPKIVVPGNHDISLYNIIRRFFKPLKRFEKYILNNPFPEYEDDKMLVVGINSSRSLTIQSGRVSNKQILYLQKRFEQANVHKFKALVVHHNVVPIKGEKFSNVIGRSSLLMKFITDCKINAVLSGHLHRGCAVASNENFTNEHNVIFIQAGTATSSRVRGENNSYNLIIYDEDLSVTIYKFNGNEFVSTHKTNYYL